MARPKKAAPELPDGTAEGKTVLTSSEAAIVARVIAERDDWKTIKESEVEDFALKDDPLAMPEPAKEMRKKKKFAFRWITRTPERMDEMRTKDVPFKWWVCNAVNTPFLTDYLDPVLGCVSKMDQMLVFKPFWMFVKEQEFKNRADREVAGDYLKAKDGEKKGGGEFVAGKKISSGDVQYPVDAEAIAEEKLGIVSAGEGMSEET
ncbi:MAG: hypothetical protein WC455_17385 [Dehalococcoidia bacterium]|jgi:hypothetical protein